MIFISANYSNGHSSDTGWKNKHTKNVNLVYILLHISANLWLEIPKFGGSKKMSNFLTSQKLPPNGHIFKNPHQAMQNTLGYTYGLILDKISESWVPFKALQICWKCNFFDGPWHPLSVSYPPKMVPSCSLVICPPKTPKPRRPLVAPSLRIEIFWRSCILAKVGCLFQTIQHWSSQKECNLSIWERLPWDRQVGWMWDNNVPVQPLFLSCHHQNYVRHE